MERNSTTLSMKDHQRNTAMRNNVSNNNNNTKDHSRNHHHHHVYNYNISQRYHDDEDYMINGFSWPPRSYTCSFCKREFRSAQALGGHMNVHRKDRARLRQSPPRLSDHGRYCASTTGTSFLNLNLNNSNPNPNFSLTSPPLSSPYSAYSCPNNEKKKWAPWTGHLVEDGGTDQLDHHQHLTINGSDFAKSMKSKQSVCGVGDDHDHGFSGKNIMYDYKSFKKADQATTNVRLDLEIGLVGADSKMGRDLDLELRLGYSTY